MTEYFSHLRGGTTTYVPSDGNSITAIRHLLMFFGEDVNLAIAQFWKEHSGDFVIVPEVGYGMAPRPELCSKRSLTEALKTASIEPNGETERAWKRACQAHGVAWPSSKAA
jgi:hypothetical protein